MDFNFINFFNVPFLLKIVTLVIIAFYVIFTFIVLTQVRVMSEILHFQNAGTILRTITIIHIILAISLFAIAIVIL